MEALDRWDADEKKLFPLATRSVTAAMPIKTYVILGPPGAGKTSVVLALSSQNWLKARSVYLEDPQANPHLREISGRSSAAFSKSQEWFLRQYADFWDGRGCGALTLIDQDPRAVVLVYSRRFLKTGELTYSAYLRHLRECRFLWERIVGTAHRIQFVCLYGTRKILVQRIEGRQASAEFEEGLMDDVLPAFRTLFDSIHATTPNQTVEYDVARFSISEIVADLKARSSIQ